MPNFGVHAGFVWRQIDQLSQQDNVNRPVSAFNVPIADPRSRPRRHARQWRTTVRRFGLQPERGEPGAAGRQLPAQHAGQGRLLHARAQREQALSRQMVADGSYAYRWNRDNANGYFGQNLRRAAGRGEPERHDQHRRWPLRLRHSGRRKRTARIRRRGTSGSRRRCACRQGQPYGRTFQVDDELRRAAVPDRAIGSRQQDNIYLLDARVEKASRSAAAGRSRGFVDGYNLTNANAAPNINWGSGTTFLLPVTIVSPRLVRFGVKFDW